MALDAVAIMGGMLLAFGLHGWARSVLPSLPEFVPFEHYVVVAGLSLPLWLFLDVALGLNRAIERGVTAAGLAREFLKLNVAGLLGLALLVFLTRSVINRFAVLAFMVSTTVLMVAVRVALIRWRTYQHRAGESERLLLVGDGSAELTSWVAAVRALPFPPVVLGRLGSPGDDDTLQRLGDVADLERVFQTTGVDHVMFWPPHNHPTAVLPSLTVCEAHGIPASFSIDLDQPTLAKPKVLVAHGRPFVSFEVAPKSPEALAIKHAADFLLALVGVLLLSPLLLSVAVLILLTSGRPVFFVQYRQGRNGRRFPMLKFRTMTTDAETRKGTLKAASGQLDPTFKLRTDPRVTRLGRVLRRWSIDELPQLFNVLAGSMSLVGPRPLPVDEHQAIAGWRRRRLAMKPGITGLWQVSGRSDIAFEEWMELDVKYVDDWSLYGDLVILFRTIPAVLSGRGAY